MANTQIVLSLTEEQVAQLNTLLVTRGNQTFEQLAQSCLNRGIEDRVYRTARNKEQYQQFKEWRAMSK